MRRPLLRSIDSRPASARPRIVALAAAAVSILVLAGCLSADEGTAFNLVNRDRAADGAANLAVNDAAVTKAQGWARYLANRSGGVCSSANLIHSNLAEGAPAGWKRLGENVACRTATGTIASVVAPLQAQLMASTGHRENILDRRFTHAGIGIAAVSTGTNRWVVFETQFFAQL